MDELPAMLEKLKKKSEQFREWAEAVQNALDPDTAKTCDLDGLRAHLKKAHDLKVNKIFYTVVTIVKGRMGVVVSLRMDRKRMGKIHNTSKHNFLDMVVYR